MGVEIYFVGVCIILAKIILFNEITDEIKRGFVAVN
jgi:hypothetical protein